MLALIARNWWIVFLRGLFAVLFGVLAFVWPGITLAALILVFGFYAIFDGMMALGIGFMVGAKVWWPMILIGVLSLAAGIGALAWPALTALALLSLIAAWAIFRGIVEIMAAFQLRAWIENEWMLILGGLCSILFGVLVAFRPGAGALAVLWIIGAFAIVYGVLAIALSFKLRALRPHAPHGGGNAAIA